MQNEKSQAYRVLARKYRPQNFDQLIGQDALVRTLTNAIQSGRVAHAFMLTGVRGVGKTTTARIIAKALNYTGPDGTSGPTTGPTDDCDVCRAIAEDRHPDVMEMDAASHTGVDDIREILDGVRYAPTSARYKVYIIDEVHMLSKNAFNALLKTLEEPPPHVKFIFATTEIRKVPVTVLSRCQRFDLRRVDVDTLQNHFRWVCEQEQVKAEDEAISMVSRAADGSVRDGLSILDQAMALSSGAITTDQVKSMLGLADRTRLLDLMEAVLGGKGENALTILADLYRAGADPQTILQDLLDITHLMSKFVTVKAPPVTVEPNMATSERERAATMAQTTGVAALTRIWQVLLKGLTEIYSAPNPQASAEMVIIRLLYAADLPDPATVLKQLKDGTIVSGGASSARSAPSSSSSEVAVLATGTGSAKVMPQTAPQAMALGQPVAVANSNLETLPDVVGLLEQDGAMVLASQVVHGVELVKLEKLRLEYHPAENADPKLAHELSKRLSQITGQRWVVSISMKEGQPTLARQHEMRLEAERDAVMADPVVARVLAAFPGAKLLSITETN